MTLLLLARAQAVGVQVRFEETVTDAADVDADLVVAADGHGSELRTRHAAAFGTSVHTGSNAYIWLGTTAELSDFTFGCERTDAGWLWYHGYQFAPRSSTVIVECAQPTWRKLGLDEPVSWVAANANAGSAEAQRVERQMES